MIWFNNSVLASIISIFGCMFVILGFTYFSESVAGGLLFIALGAGLVWLGSVVSRKKAERKQNQQNQQNQR